MTERGFTLVEMLVALVIFSLLSAAGVAVLRASLTTEEGVVARLDGQSGQDRLIALFRDDIGQAIARPLTGVGDTRQPSFRGGSTRLMLVKNGWANPGEQARASIQRVEWNAQGGGATRIAHLFLDGSDPGQPATLVKARNVRFRYRQAGGEWIDRFEPTERVLLPSAVEMTIELAASPPLIIVAALPPRGTEPEAKPADPAAANASEAVS